MEDVCEDPLEGWWGKEWEGEIKIQLLSCFETGLQLCLLQHLDDIKTEDEMLYIVQIFAVKTEVNYSTLLNKSSAEEPIEPVTSDVPRCAKKASRKLGRSPPSTR